MELDTLPTLAATDDIAELMEFHRRLTELIGTAPAMESDTYSLAQPSPLRYVPTIASNQLPPLCHQGE